MGIKSGGGFGILKGRGKQNKLVSGSRFGRVDKVFNGERSGLQLGHLPKKTLAGTGKKNTHHKRG